MKKSPLVKYRLEISARVLLQLSAVTNLVTIPANQNPSQIQNNVVVCLKKSSNTKHNGIIIATTQLLTSTQQSHTIAKVLFGFIMYHFNSPNISSASISASSSELNSEASKLLSWSYWTVSSSSLNLFITPKKYTEFRSTAQRQSMRSFFFCGLRSRNLVEKHPPKAFFGF